MWMASGCGPLIVLALVLAGASPALAEESRRHMCPTAAGQEAASQEAARRNKERFDVTYVGRLAGIGGGSAVLLMALLSWRRRRTNRRTLAMVAIVLGSMSACGAEPSTAAPSSPAGPGSGSARAPGADDGWAASDALKASLATEVPDGLRVLWTARTTRVTRQDAPYLARSELYRGERTMRVGEATVHHPSSWLVARVPGHKLRILATREDWAWLRAEDKLRLDTAARRSAYVRTWVAAIGYSERRYAWIVDRVEDLQLLTSTDPKRMPRASSETDAARARVLEKKYRPVIKPLTLSGDRAPFTGAVYVNGRHHKIMRVDIRLAADGDITITETVLEQDVPIPGVYP